jgi:hypothetical protein
MFEAMEVDNDESKVSVNIVQKIAKLNGTQYY